MDERLKSAYGFGEIVGKSAKMQKVYELIEAIGPTDTVVLILGETGTGKELVARAIHQFSQRRDKSFLKIDCTALPEPLLESELFGYKKGAFTDARTDKPGKLEMAEGGTVFLDEIGEIPLSIQAKLLRVLEEQPFEPLGSVKTVNINVRIIAATNRDLTQAVEENKFRADLYYRLKVFPVVMPPLREIPEDIPLLIEYFLEKCNRFNKRNTTISQDAIDLLVHYEWPGNVRELKHTIEYAFIMSKGEKIEIEHLPEEIRKKVGVSVAKNLERGNPLEEMEKKTIIETLKRNKSNRIKTARELKMSRITLWRRMKEYNIKLD